MTPGVAVELVETTGAPVDTKVVIPLAETRTVPETNGAELTMAVETCTAPTVLPVRAKGVPTLATVLADAVGIVSLSEIASVDSVAAVWIVAGSRVDPVDEIGVTTFPVVAIAVG